MKVFYEIYEVTFPVTFFITVPGSLTRTRPGEKTPVGQQNVNDLHVRPALQQPFVVRILVRSMLNNFQSV